MQKNAFADGPYPPQTSLGDLNRSPDLTAGFTEPLCSSEREESNGKRREGMKEKIEGMEEGRARKGMDGESCSPPVTNSWIYP